MYKLFVGLRPLGKFESILEAKQHAARSGLWGVFNLLGTDGYRDSWYVFESEAKQLQQQQERTKYGRRITAPLLFS